MQPAQTNVTTFIGLAAIASAAMAVLLYVSIARDFLPGAVEMSAALSVALIFGAATLIPRASRHAMLRRLNAHQIGRVGFLAAGVGILAATAALAVIYEGFPWPAPLLLVVLMMVFAFSEAPAEG